jgi:hypothetical protein
MSKFNNLFAITIGDMSGDGHSYLRMFGIRTNLSIAEIRKAYKESVIKTKVDFNPDRYGYLNKETDITHVCAEYLDCYISTEAIDKLSAIGIDINNYASAIPRPELTGDDKEDYFTQSFYDLQLDDQGRPAYEFKSLKDFLILVLDFIGKSIDFDYKIITSLSKKELRSLDFINYKPDIKDYNDENFGFGYGLFTEDNFLFKSSDNYSW